MTGHRSIRLVVNGRAHEVTLPPNTTLLTALRDLGYTDVKNGCEQGECGACAVLLDGEPINSCMILAWQADGAQITTNAGLGTLEHPHPIQEAFADTGAIQCGFCTSGMIIATKALLDRNPDPTEAEIRNALSGNLCRCTGYGQIVSAVQQAAERLRQSSSSPSSSLAKASTASEDGREHDPRDRVLASDDVLEGGDCS